MPRFFVDPSQVRGDCIVIQGNDVNHIRNVLRMRPGDELSLSDGRGDRLLLSDSVDGAGGNLSVH